MKIVLIAGKARVGKNTFGDFLRKEFENNNLKVVTTMYAKYLKMYAQEICAWDGSDETKPRDFLQNCGNYVRIDLDKFDFFVNRMIEDVDIYSHYADIVIINDVRFPIEIDRIKEKYKENAVSVLIKRDINELNEMQQKHLSEVALDEYHNYDYIINNDKTLDEFKQEAVNIVERELK